MIKKLLDRSLAHLAVVIVLGVIAYSNTFDVPFHFDDRPNIVGNALIRDISNIPSILAGKSRIFSPRAFMHATFAVNYRFGGLETTGYHVVNFALHLVNGILLYLLVVLTGRHLGHGEKNIRTAAALASAIFVLHPVQTETVTNIVNRSMLMATACCLSGMLLFLKAVTSERRRGLYLAGLFAVSLVGMGSRENFAMFPVILFLYDLFFISRFRLKETAKHHAAYLLVLLSLGYMAYLVINNAYAKRAAVAGIPPAEYVLTQFNVHWTYLRLLALPVNQVLDYDYPIAKSLSEPHMIFSLAGYVALWAGCISLAKRRPVISFSVLWFLITLLPISFIVALTDLKLDDVIFEHRLYLPSAGIFVAGSVAMSAAADRLGVRWKSAGKGFIAAFFVLAVALAVGAHARNGVWENDISLWKDTVAKSPGKARPHNDLSIAYKNEGLIEEAIEHGNIAIKLDPASAEAYINLGNCYASLKSYDRAIKYYEVAVYLRPYYATPYYNLGVTYQYKGQTDMAIGYYEKTIELDPAFVDAHLNLGIAFLEKGFVERARAEFERVLQLEPNYDMALKRLRELESQQSGKGDTQ